MTPNMREDEDYLETLEAAYADLLGKHAAAVLDVVRALRLLNVPHQAVVAYRAAHEHRVPATLLRLSKPKRPRLRPDSPPASP